MGQPARWAERLSRDGNAAGARQCSGDSLILKLMMEKRAENKRGCFSMLAFALFSAHLFLVNFCISNDCEAAPTPGSLEKGSNP